MTVIQHIIDCDAKPSEPNGFTVAPESQQYPYEKRVHGKSVFDHTKIDLSPETSPDADEFFPYRPDDLYFPANLLDFYLAYPHRIPEEWKGKRVSFFGTIYQASSGALCVRYLCWENGECRSSFFYLSDALINGNAVVLRSS